MNVQFSAAFAQLKSYLSAKIPELKIVTYWVESGEASNTMNAMLLPASNSAEDGKITCNVNLWFYVIMDNSQLADIAEAQAAIMEKVFNAVYENGGLKPPVLKASITETEYQNAVFKPPSQRAGLARALIELVMEFDDDMQD
ncbi:MAG: hypothetical protein FWH38_05250 [Treponema sp.]|nr:hypothetical protein [Treponema sp.]